MSRTSPKRREWPLPRSTTTSAARIFQVRPDTTAGSVESLRTVVRAGWDFWYAHPDAARLVMRYSEGSTAHALQLRREWELRHLERAYDYVPEARASRSTRRAREQHAAHTLAIGVLLDTVLVSQAAALDGAFGRLPRGPRSAFSSARCRPSPASLG